jgi:hypothetical protein
MRWVRVVALCAVATFGGCAQDDGCDDAGASDATDQLWACTGECAKAWAVCTGACELEEELCITFCGGSATCEDVCRTDAASCVTGCDDTDGACGEQCTGTYDEQMVALGCEEPL